MANHVKGKVAQVMMHKEGVAIKLKDIAEDDTPLDGMFDLPLTHPNYAVLVNGALTAAASNLTVTIRAGGEIDPQQKAEISYMRLHN